MNIDLLIEYLPSIASFIMAVIFIVFINKMLPMLKNSLTENQIKIVKQWAEFLVESAERLEISDKLVGMTKKEYVMAKLMELIEQNNYQFTEEQIDNIRRAAVIIYEKTYKMAQLTADTLLDEVDA